MSTGVKVLATDCPHGPDEILKSGAIGFITEVESAEALSQSIIKALSVTDYDKSAQLEQAKIYTSRSSALAYREVLMSGKS
jgi:glycosyltransferase involved in cell wall biosynthesis